MYGLLVLPCPMCAGTLLLLDGVLFPGRRVLSWGRGCDRMESGGLVLWSGFSSASTGSRAGVVKGGYGSTIAPFCGLKITVSCGCARTGRAERFPWSQGVREKCEGSFRAVGRGRRCGRSPMRKNWATGLTARVCTHVTASYHAGVHAFPE